MKRALFTAKGFVARTVAGTIRPRKRGITCEHAKFDGTHCDERGCRNYYRNFYSLGIFGCSSSAI